MFEYNIGELREQLDNRMMAVRRADWESLTQRSVSSGTPVLPRSIRRSSNSKGPLLLSENTFSYVLTRDAKVQPSSR